jgi:hypothetical protein
MMVSTSFAAVALAGLVASSPLVPTWQSDYASALGAAAREQKPLAVFIGSGVGGVEKVVADGKLTDDESAKLASQFVCVYIDTATDAGRQQAAAFRVTDGLVISDKAGALQAVRHEGPVDHANLSRYLTTYANATVTTTEVHARPVVAAPVVVQPVAYPQPVFGGFRQQFGVSDCPNCRR